MTGFKDRKLKLEEVEILWMVKDIPQCVRLWNAWEQRGFLYMQVELCEGGSLQEYIDEKGRTSSHLDEFQIWNILCEIALVSDLNLLHILSSFVDHLKPSNILITGNGKLKISDFGLATRCPLPPDFEREGDRTYMAPEIMESKYGKSCDIFSLGLIILEVTANIILPENGPHWHQLREGDLSACRFVDVSPPLIDLIKSMLLPSPERRPTADNILQHPFVSALCFSLETSSLFS
ncbi:hypothetical protein HDU76_007250 [Blyttiomyces sp. JEL0837]|nr:hypothetical protein HDU76_007250 [Blyttiomyces sp. JEL0837]